MIIFGFSVFYFGTTGEGLFFCPHCRGDRYYQRRVGRRWFTLFFLPVIPLDRVSEGIECQHCRIRFVLDVLTVPTQQQIAWVLPLIFRTLAMSMLRVGDSEAGRQYAIEVVRFAGANGYGDAELAADRVHLPPRLDAATYHLLRQFPPDERELMLTAAARVAVADGPMSDLEQTAVAELGDYLGLSHASVHGVIGMAEQEAQSRLRPC